MAVLQRPSAGYEEAVRADGSYMKLVDLAIQAGTKVVANASLNKLLPRDCEGCWSEWREQ